MAALTVPTLPTLHLNGTARERLAEDNATAIVALARAMECLQDAAPNARDYYPQVPGAFAAARLDHADHIARLRSVFEELGTLAEHLAG